MKKFTSLLITCSMVLAGAALAQQPTEQQSPEATQKPKHAGEAHHGNEAKSNGANANTNATTNTNGAAAATQSASPTTRRAERQARRAERHGKGAEATSASTSPNEAGAKANTTDANQSTTAASPNAKQTRKEERQARHGKGNASPNTSPVAGSSPATNASPAATAAAAAQTGANVNQANVNANNNAGRGGKKQKPDQQKVQQIKTEHASFKAQPKPQQIPAVTYNQSYRIQGAERWQGPQYEVFRSYHPERHDQGWYHSHYNRVELIGGGYYYWNNGYWFPAWGYSPSQEYYVYDAPIYVGQSARPADQVIADVQAELADMGYYTGEVDGLLGPLTRQALTEYQQDQNLMVTAVIDEPTLNSLDLSS